MRTHRRFEAAVLVAVASLAALAPGVSEGQGCVAVRAGGPALGAQAKPYADAKTWQATFGYRYFKSDRHFIGPDEQKEREEEGSQVINRVHLLDGSVSYHFTKRTSAYLSVPYLMSERSSPMRDPGTREVLDRSESTARGLGDVIGGVRFWVLDPDAHEGANFQVGLGLKLPTGESSFLGTRRRILADGSIATSIETVDQSIQPGDGGFGFVLDYAAFVRFLENRAGLYLSGTYIFNPEETDKVLTYRGRESEMYMSIADQYILRFGASGSFADDWTVSLGGRLEGVPAEDVFGGSEWFRRPGYAWSIEPALTWGHGRNGVLVAVPFAVYRNRTVSVPDEKDGRHGDAAFADYNIILNYTRSF